MKKIVIIDDRLKHAEQLVLTVAAIMTYTINRIKKADGDAEDIHIQFLQVVDLEHSPGTEDDYKDHLRELKSNVDARLCGKIPDELTIAYEYVDLRRTSEVDSNADALVARMHECLKKAYQNHESVENDKPGMLEPDCILLDMILFEPYDEEIINPTDQGKSAQILSHAIFKKYKDCCLPYSSYPPQAVIAKWCALADYYAPDQLNIIANGRAIYLPFQKKLLGKLGL